MTQLVEEVQQNARTTRVLSRQRDKMFHGLVTRIQAFSTRLGVDAPAFSLDLNQDVAAYLAFFDMALVNLEEAAASLDTVVEEESHELLAVAVGRIFSNLSLIEPHFDFHTMTEPIAPEHYHCLDTIVRDDVNAYVKRFRRVGAEEEEDNEDASEEAGDAPGDGAPEA